MAYRVLFQAFGREGEFGMKEEIVADPYSEALKRACAKSGCVDPVIWEIKKDGELVYSDNRRYKFKEK